MEEKELTDKQKECLTSFAEDTSSNIGEYFLPSTDDDRRTLNALVRRGLMDKDEERKSDDLIFFRLSDAGWEYVKEHNLISK